LLLYVKPAVVVCVKYPDVLPLSLWRGHILKVCVQSEVLLLLNFVTSVC